jgi:glycine hydroxymethyltransferase
VVTTTTHKTLRGPRAGLIFFRKNGEGDKAGLEARVNQAVFPSNQGGPHNNTIAGVAVTLKQAASPEFRQYAKQVRANASRLAEALAGHGYKIATNGTDNHLILWDLRPIKLTGSKFEKICDLLHITINKNSVHGDVSALTPGGCRFGTAALTSRSFKEDDFVKVAEFLHRAVQIALAAQEKAGSKLLKDFVAVLENNEDITALRQEVVDYATTFPMPGFDASQIKRFQ